MAGRIFLIHWHAEEAGQLAEPLQAAGWEVTIEAQDGARAVQSIQASRPDAIVIYLRRLPSHGRETAHALKEAKATGELTLLFVDGAPEKVEQVRARVPDAEYLRSAELEARLSALKKASPK